MNGIGVLRDRFSLGLMAMVVVGVGAVMLCWPVRLDAHDRWGFQISCGSGLGSDDGQATAARDDAEGARDYVDGCHSAVLQRRVWAATLVTLGGAGAAASAWVGQRGRKSTVNDEFDWKKA
jgi:hypothetical protein